MNTRWCSSWMKSWFNMVVVSTLCLTFMPVYKTSALPLPCDTNWSWGTLPSQPPQSFSGPLADIGGVVYVVGANANGALALMAYTSQRWYTYATFNNGGVSVMATYGNTLYIGGPFEGFLNSGGGTVNATNVAALNTSNGQWTPIGTGTPVEEYGVHADVQSMTVDSTGLLYVGLDRTPPADPSTGLPGMLVKWDTAGQQWVSVGGGFHIDSYNNYCGNPVAPKIAPNWGITALTAVGTDIYVAGYFDLCGAGSVTTYHLARWVASSQSWVPLAPNRDWCYFYALSNVPRINSLLVSGNLYVAGDFGPNCDGSTTPQGVAEVSITGGGVLNTPGDNLWGDYFDSQGVQGYDPGIGYALVQRNCGVYLAGGFRSIGSVGGPSGVQAWGIAKKVNGTWRPLAEGLSEPDINGNPTWGIGIYLATDPANDTNHVYVQGSFDTAGTLPAPGFAVWQGPAAIQPPPPPARVPVDRSQF